MTRKKRNRKTGFLNELLDAVISAFLIALIVKSIFFDVAKIPTSSMEDTLMINDILIVDKFMYGINIPFTKLKFNFMEKRHPKTGDAVVFIPPSYTMSDKPLFVKRCVAVPGDKIYTKNNVLYINGKKISEKYLKIDPDKREYFKNWPFKDKNFYTANREKLNLKDPLPDNFPPIGKTYTVPKGYYFMMGDHRTDSYDSRFWGPVPYKKVIGVVRLRIFPFHRLAFIH